MTRMGRSWTLPNASLHRIVDVMENDGFITQVESNKLKVLIDEDDILVSAAIDAYEKNLDLEDLVDTLKRISQQQHV